MTSRAQKKQETRERILSIASRKLREEGLRGLAIGPLMKEAGLTHGTFYAHFDNGEQLAAEAMDHAANDNMPQWIEHQEEDWTTRLSRLAAGYLDTRHRDGKGMGCPIGALASEASIGPEPLRHAFENAVTRAVSGIAENDDEHTDDAIALLALCVGAINLSRAVDDDNLSRQILEACQDRATRLSEN